jgi:hypothetical protein
MQALSEAKETFVAMQGRNTSPQPVMKSSLGLQLLFFVLMAALLVRVAMGIHPRARAEAAAICSTGAPAGSVRPPQPLPR